MSNTAISSKNKIKSNSSFLIQGSILAVAGILVRIIGLIYRIPLNNILGKEGLGYYGTAYNIYSILLLLSSQSMPIAVSKLVSERLSKKEYRNAHRMFFGALAYAVIIGTAFGLVAFFGADALAGFYERPSCARALKVLAPTLTMVSIIGVFRGYFQGMGDVVPTAISQLLEQVVNAIVSVFAAYQLYDYGRMIAAGSQAEAATNAASYSAAGGTLGTCLGAFAAFVTLFVIYMHNRKNVKAEIAMDAGENTERYSLIGKVLVFTITPILFSTTIYQVGNLIDDAIFGKIMSGIYGYTESMISEQSGIYNNYKLLTTMPMAIASALTLSLVPSVVSSFKTNHMDDVKEKIDMALKFTMIISFPCGVGLSVLGGPVYVLLFPALGIDSMTTIMMSLSVFTVVFFSMSTITNSILQGVDRLKVPIFSSGISLMFHLVFLPFLLIVLKLNIYAVVVGDFVFAFMICVLNSMALKKYINYGQDYNDTILKPMISAVIMGIITFVSFNIFNFLMRSVYVHALGEMSRKTGIIFNDVSVIAAIIIAIPAYFVTLIKMGGLTESQIKQFPKGTMILKICRKIHLL